MSAISALRASLLADLSVLGIPVHGTWPVNVEAPCAFVAPPIAFNYIEPSDLFGHVIVHVDLVILVGHAPAEDALPELEGLIGLALVNTVDWTLRAVEPPAPITVTDHGAEYLGTLIHLSKSIQL